MDIGEFVHYSTKGICKVDSMEELKFGNEEKQYYVLIPVFDKNAKYYVPIDYDPNRVQIRNAITRSAVEELIAFAKTCEPFDWLNNANERKEKNEEILKSADHRRIIRLIKTLRTHEEQQKRAGKKMYLSDTKALKSAIHMISDEFAFVKGEDPKTIASYFEMAV